MCLCSLFLVSIVIGLISLIIFWLGNFFNYDLLLKKVIKKLENVGITLVLKDFKIVLILLTIPFLNIIYFIFIISIWVAMFVNNKLKEEKYD